MKSGGQIAKPEDCTTTVEGHRGIRSVKDTHTHTLSHTQFKNYTLWGTGAIGYHTNVELPPFCLSLVFLLPRHFLVGPQMVAKKVKLLCINAQPVTQFLKTAFADWLD